MNLLELGDSREVVIVGVVDDRGRLENFFVDALKMHVETAIRQCAKFFIEEFIELPRVNQPPLELFPEQINLLAAQFHDLVKVGVEQELDIFMREHILNEL